MRKSEWPGPGNFYSFLQNCIFWVRRCFLNWILGLCGPVRAKTPTPGKAYSCHFSVAARFAPDGSRIVTGSDVWTTKVWDSLSGNCNLTLTGHALRVRSAVFSKDGARILTASNDCTAKIWNSYTGSCETTLEGHRDHLTSAAFGSVTVKRSNLMN